MRVTYVAAAPHVNRGVGHGRHIHLGALDRRQCHRGGAVCFLHKSDALVLGHWRNALAYQDRRCDAGGVVAQASQVVAVCLRLFGEHFKRPAHGLHTAIARLHNHVGANDRGATVSFSRLPQALRIELAGNGIDLLVARCPGAVTGLHVASGSLQIARIHHAHTGFYLAAGDGGDSLGVPEVCFGNIAGRYRLGGFLPFLP